MEILINIIIAIIFSIISWYVTRYYYIKSLDDQAAQWSKTESLFLSKFEGLAISDQLVVYEQRIFSAIQDYQRKGTPKYVIDTYSELSFAEKEKMYDDVLLRIKGRKGKNNPYRQSSE